MQKRQKPAANIQDIRYRACQWLADLENGEITNADAKARTGVAMVIIKACAVELTNNQLSGISGTIDFLVDENRTLGKSEDSDVVKIDRPKSEYSNTTPYGIAKEAIS